MMTTPIRSIFALLTLLLLLVSTHLSLGAPLLPKVAAGILNARETSDIGALEFAIPHASSSRRMLPTRDEADILLADTPRDTARSAAAYDAIEENDRHLVQSRSRAVSDAASMHLESIDRRREVKQTGHTTGLNRLIKRWTFLLPNLVARPMVGKGEHYKLPAAPHFSPPAKPLPGNHRPKVPSLSYKGLHMPENDHKRPIPMHREPHREVK